MEQKKQQLSSKKLEEVKKHIDLIKKVLKDNGKESSDAFSEIVKMLDPKIKNLVNNFDIKGHGKDDLYQEALIALHSKAIQDYDPERSNFSTIAPFDAFAMLCIRRHLTTTYRTSLQRKNSVLNVAESLDKDRSAEQDYNTMCLSDIMSDNNPGVLHVLSDKEENKILFQTLFDNLSKFEKDVFLLYAQKNSYVEIADKINKIHKKKKLIKEKSVDNALSRIKTKAKQVLKDLEYKEKDDNEGSD